MNDRLKIVQVPIKSTALVFQPRPEHESKTGGEEERGEEGKKPDQHATVRMCQNAPNFKPAMCADTQSAVIHTQALTNAL